MSKNPSIAPANGDDHAEARPVVEPRRAGKAQTYAGIPPITPARNPALDARKEALLARYPARAPPKNTISKVYVFSIPDIQLYPIVSGIEMTPPISACFQVSSTCRVIRVLPIIMDLLQYFVPWVKTSSVTSAPVTVHVTVSDRFVQRRETVVMNHSGRPGGDRPRKRWVRD